MFEAAVAGPHLNPERELRVGNSGHGNHAYIQSMTVEGVCGNHQGRAQLVQADIIYFTAPWIPSAARIPCHHLILTSNRPSAGSREGARFSAFRLSLRGKELGSFALQSFVLLGHNGAV